MEIKYYKLQKIMLFIPIINLFTFFIWGINMISYSKHIERIKQISLAFVTFVVAYISWRILSIGLTVSTYYIESSLMDTILTYSYYYLCGIVLTIIWMISEKKFIDIINKNQ